MGKREKSLAGNTAILIFGTLCTKGLMFIMTPFFTRWLIQEDYGIFDLLLNYVTLVIPIITLNVGEALFRFLIKEDNEGINTLVSNTIFVDAIGLTISAIVVFLIYYLKGGSIRVIICFFLVLLAETIYNFFNMVMRGLKQMKAFAFANVIYISSMILASIVLVKMLDAGLVGILISYSIGYCVSALFMAFKSSIWNYIHVRNIRFSVLKSMLKYSMNLIPNSVAWWVMNVSDRTIVTLYMGSSYSAILAVAHKLPNLCQNLFGKFHLSWQQSASECIDDTDRDIYFSGVLNSLLKIMCPLVAFMISLNYFFFSFVFTKEYFFGFYIMPIMLISILLYMICQFMGGIYIAKMESNKNGATTTIAMVVNLIVHFGLIKFIGLYAAVVSTFVAYCVLLAVRYIDIRKTVHIRIYKSTLICITLLVYFFIVGYAKNYLIEISNIILALFVAVLFNYNIVKSIYKLLIGKLKKVGNNI